MRRLSRTAAAMILATLLAGCSGTFKAGDAQGYWQSGLTSALFLAFPPVELDDLGASTRTVEFKIETPRPVYPFGASLDYNGHADELKDLLVSMTLVDHDTGNGIAWSEQLAHLIIRREVPSAYEWAQPWRADSSVGTPAPRRPHMVLQPDRTYTLIVAFRGTSPAPTPGRRVGVFLGQAAGGGWKAIKERESAR